MEGSHGTSEQRRSLSILDLNFGLYLAIHRDVDVEMRKDSQGMHLEPGHDATLAFRARSLPMSITPGRRTRRSQRQLSTCNTVSKGSAFIRGDKVGPRTYFSIVWCNSVRAIGPAIGIHNKIGSPMDRYYHTARLLYSIFTGMLPLIPPNRG